jgi:hypothetical protein
MFPLDFFRGHQSQEFPSIPSLLSVNLATLFMKNPIVTDIFLPNLYPLHTPNKALGGSTSLILRTVPREKGDIFGVVQRQKK